MAIIDKYIAYSFFAIFTFLILSRANSVNTIVKSLGTFATNQTFALQGRTADGSSVVSGSIL